jgi:hypothetical protein
VQLFICCSDFSVPTLDLSDMASILSLTSPVYAQAAIDRDSELGGAARHVGEQALATIVFGGMQPVFTQVPPNNLRSDRDLQAWPK